MKTGVWVLILIIVLGGGYWWWQQQNAATAISDGTPATQNAIEDSASPTTSMPAPGAGTNTDEMQVGGSMTSATILYDGKAFSLSPVTIKAGDTVTFESTTGTMWVASSVHPTHADYDGTSRSEHCAPGYTGATPFDQCASGSTYSFTFDKVGTFRYHDHMNASAFGTIVVQ